MDWESNGQSWTKKQQQHQELNDYFSRFVQLSLSTRAAVVEKPLNPTIKETVRGDSSSSIANELWICSWWCYIEGVLLNSRAGYCCYCWWFAFRVSHIFVEVNLVFWVDCATVWLKTIIHYPVANGLWELFFCKIRFKLFALMIEKYAPFCPWSPSSE